MRADKEDDKSMVDKVSDGGISANETFCLVICRRWRFLYIVDLNQT